MDTRNFLIVIFLLCILGAGFIMGADAGRKYCPEPYANLALPQHAAEKLEECRAKDQVGLIVVSPKIGVWAVDCNPSQYQTVEGE